MTPTLIKAGDGAEGHGAKADSQTPPLDIVLPAVHHPLSGVLGATDGILGFLGARSLVQFAAACQWTSALREECEAVAASRVPPQAAWPGRSELFSLWALEEPRAAVGACWTALLELLQMDFETAAEILQGRFCVGYLYNANYVPSCVVQGGSSRGMLMVEEVALVELAGPPQPLAGRGAYVPCKHLYDEYRLRGSATGCKWERNRAQGKRNTCDVVRIALRCPG